MARPRKGGVKLPEGVHAVTKPNGRTYYYYAPKRGTINAGSRVSLGIDLGDHSILYDPEFWRQYRSAKGETEAGTFAALIGEYRSSGDWEQLRTATKRDYSIYLDRLIAQAGDRAVRMMEPRDIYQLRDSLSRTPVAANHMLSVLRALIKWGIPRGYRDDNPVIGVEKLKIDQGGARPWPEEGFEFVLRNAPEDLRRMAFLGRASGQRASDLVKMRASDLDVDGIYLYIRKLRGDLRDERHFVPLTKDQMDEIKSWGVKDLDVFLKSPAGKPYTADHLGSRWDRWRKSDVAKPIVGLKLTIHGLRATAVDDRRRAGTPDGAIADELGMSVQMVARYARFADKAASARASRDRREGGTK
jgi:integrase